MQASGLPKCGAPALLRYKGSGKRKVKVMTDRA